MTERLDRIEAILEATAQKQSENAVQIGKNADETDTLLGAIATTDRQVQDLRGESADAKQRFEVLRAEAQNDRTETRQLWNDAITQMEQNQAEAKADREEHARRFDAQQETIQRLLLAIVDLSRDNNRLRDRMDGLEGAA